MRLPALLALAMLVSAGAPARAVGAQTPHPAVVRVIAAEPGGASLGSGTLVDVNDQHGLVITNWHVVRDAPQSVVVVFPDGFQSLGRVLRMDSNWDLAAILINRPQTAPVRVAREAPRIGEMLTIAGYGSGAYRAVAGACTQYLAPSLQHPYELVELAASARQGDSGGPILNSRGELAGVLFGEGGGRTTGAYCGRVHSFLALAVEQLHKQGAPAIAAASPQQVQGASRSEYFTASAMHTGVAQPNTSANAPGEHWRAKIAAPGGGTLASDRENMAHWPQSSDIDASGAPSRAAAPPLARANGSPATTLAPVAAIVQPPAAEVKTSSIASSSPPANDGWAPPSETDTLDWQFFLGNTLVAQVKSVLACIGLVAVLFYGTRTLARTTLAGSKPIKRSKR